MTKADYFAGKFLGGYLLIVFLIALNMLLSVVSASIVFGPQSELYTLPLVFAAEIFSALLFFGVGFMFGEVVRRSSLAYIISSALFFTSEIFGIALTLIYTLTSSPFYRQIQIFLPTSPITSLGLLVETPYLPPRVNEAPYIRLLRGRGGDFHSFHPCLDSSVLSLGLRNLFCLL